RTVVWREAAGEASTMTVRPMIASWVAEVWAAGWRPPAGAGPGQEARMTSSVGCPPQQPLVPKCSGTTVLAWQQVVLRHAARHRDWMPRAQAAASGQWKLRPQSAAS